MGQQDYLQISLVRKNQANSEEDHEHGIHDGQPEFSKALGEVQHPG